MALGGQDPALPTPASRRPFSFAWNQAEREVGFAHWAEVFPTQPIAKGAGSSVMRSATRPPGGGWGRRDRTLERLELWGRISPSARKPAHRETTPAWSL